MIDQTVSRRQFLAVLAMGATSLQRAEAAGSEPTTLQDYQRPSTDWLGKCRYGIGIHWTAQTTPRHGRPMTFQKAVEAFKLKQFLEGVTRTGADYVLFTAAHALQMLPAPNPVVDKLLPGRTCERDLLGELADGLAAQGLPFLVYYNHSCNSGQDSAWEKAVGYHASRKEQLAENLMEIVAWMSERYGKKIRAWWFDSPYSLDPRGPHNSVTTDMSRFQFPWEQFTVAAKRGFPERLVTYNAGVKQTYLYTRHQDYWAGEMNDLKSPAQSHFLSNGLQWFGWTCLDNPAWVHTKLDAAVPPPLYPDGEIIAFVRTCNSHQAPMTFNVGIYQDGTTASSSVDQLHRLSLALKTDRQ